MPRPTPALRKDFALWSISGALVLVSTVLLLAARSEPTSTAPSAPVELAAPSVQPPQGRTDAAPSADRLTAFHSRLTAYRPLEAMLLRAFLPPAPPPSLRPTIRLARVVPAKTPQACLAQAVYYEARGEPAEGQAAVAQVVLNRTHSGRHPADVCGAVFEGARRPGCQFSFACDPRLAGRPLEPGAWRRAQGVAAEVMAGRGPAGLDDAVNYHADYVHPRWAAQFQRTAEIGRHIFYASAFAARRALAGWTFTAPAPPSGA